MGRLKLTAVVFLSFLFKWNSAQYSNSYAYEWQTAADCTDTQFFNSVTFKCANCNDQLVANKQKSDCVCKSPLKSVVDNHPTQCVECPKGQTSSQSPSVCVECFNQNGQTVSADSTGHCPQCQNNSIPILLLTQRNGTLNGRQICSACPLGKIPNTEQTECVPCFTHECLCSQNSTFCEKELEQTTISAIVETEITANFQSSIVDERAQFVAHLCRQNNIEACHSLANLCVLQNYNRDVNTACTLLESLRTAQNSESVPSPVYLNTEANVELYRESAIDAVFNVETNAENSRLDFILAVYALNGSFLGMRSVDSGLLQVCPSKREVQEGAFKFGRLYDQNCRLAISEVVKQIQQMETTFGFDRETHFYEIYIRYVSRYGKTMMYNVPIINENIRLRGEFINRQNYDSRWILTKRFFLVDRQLNIERSAELIRVPSLMSFHINMQLSRDGRIFPPYFRIRHNQYYNDANQQVDLNGISAAFRFRVQYIIDSFRHDKTIEVIMATLCSSSVLWGAFKAYSWSRRAGKLVVDAATIITFVLNVADHLGNVFLLVMGCTAVWITFAYKLQKAMVYVPLAYEQEWSFLAYIISATALKGIGLIHTYLKLIFTETFFVDWERPRSGIDRSRETTMLDISTTNDLNSQKQKRTIPVVIWRTYLIANEWNELQYYRKTSIALQLVVVLLLLDGLQFGDYAIIEPGFERNQPSEYAHSRMSRFALDIAVYLIVCLIQWVVTVLIIEKIADPFRNFMDLCSVANISVIAFSHPLHAYYIHGRSVHGMADTDMTEMNLFLQREKENLCGLRGLESNSELQTFVVCLPRTFREKMDELMAAMRSTSNQRSGVNGDRVTAKVENSAKIHAEITQFVKDFIDHADPDCDYVITDPKFIEDILDIELNDTTKIGSFIRDPSEMAYSSVFIYGNEWSHMSFEMLLFALLDLVFGSRILSAAIVYVVSVLITTISKVFFTNNLVKSSLVDHRFLI
ncbi:hypothetical protein M3Y95_01181900 [Aphelenchoides besseyi]|nr:hypothetical protein M3Y95_01181900 [Aphelenchoides besseyi]